MNIPAGYLLTWTCYGTWLHGDERGSVDREHNQLGKPLLPPNPRWVSSTGCRLSHSEVFLDDRARLTVEQTIKRHCEIRKWDLHACNVRTNHVHVVVSAGEVDPDDILKQLKAWTTRVLREESWAKRDAPVWTEGGSKRYLWNDDQIAGAVAYVLDRQGPEYH